MSWDNNGWAQGPDETTGFDRARTDAAPAQGGWGEPAQAEAADGGWGAPAETAETAAPARGGWGEEDTTPNNSGGWGEQKTEEAKESGGYGHQESAPADTGGGWQSRGNDEGGGGGGWGESHATEGNDGNDRWGGHDASGGETAGEWANSGLSEEEQRKIDCENDQWWNWDKKTDDKGFEYWQHPFEENERRFANGNAWVDWDTAETKGTTIEDRGHYIAHPDIANMPQEEVVAYREDKRIFIKEHDGAEPPNPITTFEMSGLPEYVVQSCQDEGFEAPTAIQSQCWPIILQGRDCVGVSQTGSGKTLAYLGPLTVHICAQEGLLQEGDGPIGLILSPTRELVVQIKGQIDRFAATTGILSAALFGGQNQREQESAVKMQNRKFQTDTLNAWSPPEVVVASVGRLRDFIDKGHTNLRNVTYFVLDEADNLLGQGWKDDITAFRQSMRKSAQTLLFTATYSDPSNNSGDTIRDYAKVLCRHEPVHVYIGEDVLVASEAVEQRFKQHPGYRAERTEVAQMVADIIHEVDNDASLWDDYGYSKKYICFCNSRAEIDDLCDTLREVGCGATSLHGQMEQKDREYAMEQFKTDPNTKMLVGTDLLSRGLDLPEVACVILTNLPNDATNYVHRIGRTGRAGKKGISYAFINPDGREDWMVKEGTLVEVLQGAKQEIPEILSGGYGGGGGGNSWGQNERSEEDTVNKENEDAQDSRDKWSGNSWGNKDESSSWNKAEESNTWDRGQSSSWGN